MSGIPKNVYDALEYPKTCAPDDFWGQVRRTVHGKPVPQEQIDMIFAMVRDALQFEPDDALLDLCCGNGVLGSAFFDEIGAYVGVDMSPYLIEVGEKNFQRLPTHIFKKDTAIAFCTDEQRPERFGKALWFSAFSYFSDADAARVLSLLRTRFTGLRRLFIGSLPDEEQAPAFWGEREIPDLSEHTSAIGKWRSRKNFLELVAGTDWKAEILESPCEYYQAHYRYNALLTR